MDEAHLIIITFDPHVSTALQCIAAALVILGIMKFIDFLNKKAKQR